MAVSLFLWLSDLSVFTPISGSGLLLVRSIRTHATLKFLVHLKFSKWNVRKYDGGWTLALITAESSFISHTDWRAAEMLCDLLLEPREGCCAGIFTLSNFKNVKHFKIIRYWSQTRSLYAKAAFKILSTPTVISILDPKLHIPFTN